MKIKFFPMSLIALLTFNLANADIIEANVEASAKKNTNKFFEIGAGVGKSKFENKSSLILGFGRMIELKEASNFLTFGFETQINSSKGGKNLKSSEVEISIYEFQFNNVDIQEFDFEYTLKTTKVNNKLSNLLYLSFGRNINNKFSVYGKIGLAHEMLAIKNTKEVYLESQSFQAMWYDLQSGELTLVYVLETEELSNISNKSTKHAIGFGYGLGTSYKLSQSSDLNIELLMKQVSTKDGSEKIKLNNRSVKVGYRVFF
jgi:opacity protein-like surface antigen